MTFWILEERDTFLREGEKTCYFEIMEPSIYLSSKKCPSCGASLEPGIWKKPHKIKVSSSFCGDLIQGSAFELIVSEQFRSGFEKENLTGLSFLGEVAINPQLEERYFVARPSVVIMSLDEESSEVVWRKSPSCSLCRLGVRKSINQVVCKKEGVPDLDIFSPTGLYGVKLVSKRFFIMVNELGFSNILFIHPSNYREKIGS